MTYVTVSALIQSAISKKLEVEPATVIRKRKRIVIGFAPPAIVGP